METTLTNYTIIDQFYTAGCVVRNEQGVRLSKYNITEQALTDALVAVLYDPKFVYLKKEQAVCQGITVQPLFVR